MSADPKARTGRGGNAVLALVLGGLVVGMVGLAFAAVPLYRLFCQVTGFGGTTQVAESAPVEIGERLFKVRFNTDVDGDLPWRFWPEQREVTLRVGEPGLVFFGAENLSRHTIVGAATFNVTPLKAGPYFNKVQCFCFDEQELAPGETARLGVSFFVDPAIAQDRNLDEVTTITLSYTFFRSLTDGDDRPAEEAGRAHKQASAVRQGKQVN